MRRDSTQVGLRIVVYIVLAAAFTSMIVQYSRSYGRAVVGPLYDDIFYLNDGLEYAQLLQTRGLKACLERAWANVPHSPFATFVASASFLIFGPAEWAPYALMSVVVLAVMLVADWLMSGLSTHARISGVLFTLSFPIIGTLPDEFRPDATAGLATGLGAVLMLRYSPFWSPRRHQVWVGLCFSLALVIKTPSAPFTLYMFAGSWVASALWGTTTDLLDPGREGTPTRWCCWAAVWPYALPVLLLAGPFYVVAWRGVANHVYENVFGQYRELWLRHGSWPDLARYIWDGGGGQLMVGRHGYIVIALTVVTWLGYRAFCPEIQLPARLKIGLQAGGILFLAWLMPTASRYANPFIGSTFAAILLFVGLLLLRALFQLHWQRPWLGAPRVPIGVVSGWVAVTAALLVFHWPTRIATKTTDWVVTDTRVRREVYRAIQNASTTDGYFGLVYVTSTSEGLNPEILRFRALNEQMPLSFFGLPYSADVAAHLKAIEGADYVVAGDQGTFRRTHVPSYAVQGKILEALRIDGELRLLATIPAYDGLNFYLFGRGPAFGGWTAATGLAPPEGPYRPAGNRMVRWGLGPMTVLTVASVGVREGMVEFVGLTMTPGQVVELVVNGAVVTRSFLEPRDGFTYVKAAVKLSAGLNRVELRYAAWHNRPNVPAMAVLFKSLRIK